MPPRPYAATADPATAPTIACVVDTGSPVRVANSTQPAAPEIAASPAERVGDTLAPSNPLPNVASIAPVATVATAAPAAVHRAPHIVVCR
jgi:hypothetical protein